MNSPTSEFGEETLTREAPAPPIHYPLSARRYLLAGLRLRRPRPKDGEAPPSFAMARPRRMKQSARALLWWIPCWYVLAQLILVVWMDESWQLNRTRVEHDKWEQLHTRLAEAPDRPLVLMFGSSRTDWAFQAGRLSGQPGPDGRPLLAYNFGVPTTGPLHEALYINDLLDEGIHPRLLLVELVTTHLNQSRRGILSEERFTVPPWLSVHQLLFLRPYLSNSRRAMIEWLESRLAPWYGFRWTVHEHLQGHHSIPRPYDQACRPMDSWGCRMLYEDPGTPEFRAWRWAGAGRMYGDSLQRFRLGAGPAQAMRDLLARCRREHIPVALVIMPVTKEFNALYSPEGRAELENFLAELRERYGVEVVDASDWLDKKDFDDGHHVLKAGAYKFTTRMIAEVQKLLARTEPPGKPPVIP
jgi:hypothetical protein